MLPFYTPNSFYGLNVHIYVNNYYLVSLDVLFSHKTETFSYLLCNKFTNLINKCTKFKDKENFVENLKEFIQILLKEFNPAAYMYELLPEFEKVFPIFSTRKEISEFLGIPRKYFHTILDHKIFLDLIMDKNEVYGNIFKDKSINIVTTNNKAEVIYDSSLRCVYEYDSRANKINYFH